MKSRFWMVNNKIVWSRNYIIICCSFFGNCFYFILVIMFLYCCNFYRCFSWFGFVIFECKWVIEIFYCIGKFISKFIIFEVGNLFFEVMKYFFIYYDVIFFMIKNCCFVGFVNFLFLCCKFSCIDNDFWLGCSLLLLLLLGSNR